MIDTERHDKLLESFIAIVDELVGRQKKPRNFGPQMLLYPAESQAIERIGVNPEMSVTQLAQTVGVTKGAMSQTLARLQAKQLVSKIVHPVNKSRKVLRLTPRGKRVFDLHRENIGEHRRQLNDYLVQLKPEELKVLRDFFGLLKDHSDGFI